MGLSAVLASPEFLFRIEQDPAGAAPGASYRISDLELASRLSFFLWSSIPDDELLDVAARGELEQARGARSAGDAHAGRPAVAQPGHQLRGAVAAPAQPRLDHARHAALSRISTTTCGRRSGRRPSCSSTASCARTAACSTCCAPNYTFVNERLAKHYGIPNVYGSRFRRVDVRRRRQRSAAGCLRQGSILIVTSYADAHVAGDSRQVDARQPARRAAAAAAGRRAGAQGRQDRRDRRCRCASGWPSIARIPSCASCHQLMDPVGFALENYDAVGRWRTRRGRRSRSTHRATFSDGTEFDGVAGLQKAILRASRALRRHADRKAADVRTGPRRRVLRRAGDPQDRARRERATDYRFSSIVMGIVNSTPFQNEESHHDHHQESSAAADVSARHGRHPGAAAARRDGSVADRAGRRRRRAPCGASASSTCRWAAHITQLDAARRERRARRAVAHAQPARAGEEARHRAQQHGAEERVSGHARDVERRVPERRQGEVDREHRLLSRHDRRSDRGASRSGRKRSCRRSSWRWI